MFNFLIKSNINNHNDKNIPIHKILMISDIDIDLKIFEKIQLKNIL